MAVAALWLAACATTRPTPPTPSHVVELRGLASWYGDEFAGRPTANGEIFDPKQLTAAHRTLPFGSLVEVTYTRTGRSTRVRVNDRGPFVGNRIIDLSYAAAVELGMIDDGIGEIEMRVLSVGAGELEPPKPYSVTIPAAAQSVPEPAGAVESATSLPIPASEPPRPAKAAEPEIPMQGEPVVIIEEIEPSAEHPAVASSPVLTAQESAAPPPPPPAPPSPPRQEPAPPPLRNGWAVQLGAFSVESNAIELKSKVERVTRPVSIDSSGRLYRVRVGPWASRSRAIEEKERLEAAGYQAIVVSVN